MADKKHLSKKVKRIIKNTLLVLLGSFIMSFGTGVFFIPCNMVAGGLSGIGIIVEHFLGDVSTQLGGTVDITVFILTWIFFFIGLIFLGKRFSINTLIATVASPLFLSLIIRTHMFDFISKEFVVTNLANPDAGEQMKLLIAALFGGALIGAGVAITFVGEGSTGGLDVLQFLFHKWFNIRHSTTSFACDATIILAWMIINAVSGNSIVPSLIGILSAFVTALVIRVIYGGSRDTYLAEIISDKHEAIMKYIHEVMDRSGTYVEVIGGYSKDKKMMIKVAFDASQLNDFKKFLAETDESAFIILSKNSSIIGEGFEAPIKERRRLHELMKNNDKDYD